LLVVALVRPELALASIDRLPESPSPFAVSSPTRPRNFILSPLASFFLPGFDQYWEGQWEYGALYTGLFAGGFVTSNLVSNGYIQSLGTQLMGASGGISLYHSFRSAVKTQQKNGRFLFLEHEESPLDIAKAPFDFGYLGRPTTLIPFLLAFGLGFLGRSALDRQYGPIAGDQALYSLGTGYLAGTWEEAAFRGWMMPVLYHYTGSQMASNAITASLFAAAHYADGRPLDALPWPQLIFGLYAGHMVQQNKWTLGEAIFVHSWWNTLVMTGQFLRTGSATIRLPTIHVAF
jgi:membrane protease YdiL (CAAX protease family)